MKKENKTKLRFLGAIRGMKDGWKDGAVVSLAEVAELHKNYHVELMRLEEQKSALELRLALVVCELDRLQNPHGENPICWCGEPTRSKTEPLCELHHQVDQSNRAAMARLLEETRERIVRIKELPAADREAYEAALAPAALAAAMAAAPSLPPAFADVDGAKALVRDYVEETTAEERAFHKQHNKPQLEAKK